MIARAPWSVSSPSWRLSPQLVDPLGALGSRPISYLAAIAVVVYALIETVVQWDQVRMPGWALVAVLCVIAAGAVFLWASSPARAPFSSAAHCVLLALALVAAMLESFSRRGANALLQDDFGQIVVGVLILALSPYRSALWLAGSSFASAIVLGFEVPLDVGSLVIDAPFAEYVAVVVTPVLALGFAGAAFSDEFVSGVQQWHRSVSRAAIETERTTRTGVARSVQQQQVTLLSGEVLPFLLRVAASTSIDADDIAQARALASGLRGTLVREAGRTWLDDVVQAHELTSGERVRLDDPHGFAAEMTAEQRAALAALISSVSRPRDSAVIAAVIEITAVEGRRRRIRITATRSEQFARATRRTLNEYLAVIRVLFDHVRVSITGYTVAIHFDYLVE